MEKKRILIIVDCQNSFITGELRNEEAIKAVPNIMKKVQEEKWDFIFFTRDTHDTDYLETKEGEKLPVVHCLKGSHGWEIEENVMAAVEKSGVPYAIYNKFTFGLSTLPEDLEFELETQTDIDFEKDEIEVVFVGFCTDICVVSNALLLKSVWYQFADIKVAENCTAGVTPESHFAALTTMKMCQIDIL